MKFFEFFKIILNKVKFNNPILYLSLIKILSSCSYKNEKAHNIIKVYSIIPLVTENKKYIESPSYFGQISINNFLIYELPYFQVLNDSIEIKKELYFIYKAKEPKGFVYKDISDTLYKEVSVDSVLKSHTFLDLKLYDKENNILIKKEVLKNGIIKEVYKNKIIKLPTYSFSDSINIYFDKRLKGINYSLCNELDKLRNSKVSKIEFIYNSQVYKEYSFRLPARRLIFEIKEEKIEHEKYEKLIKMLEHFKINKK